MFTIIKQYFITRRNVLRFILLILFLICGVAFGVGYFYNLQKVSGSFLKNILSPVTLLGSAIPFSGILFSTFIYSLGFSACIFCPVIFAKAFSYTFSLAFCFSSFSNGAWLVSFCGLFISHISFILYIVFGFLYFVRKENVLLQHIILIIFFTTISAYINYIIIHPYLYAVFYT